MTREDAEDGVGIDTFSYIDLDPKGSKGKTYVKGKRLKVIRSVASFDEYKNIVRELNRNGEDQNWVLAVTGTEGKDMKKRKIRKWMNELVDEALSGDKTRKRNRG